MYKLRHSVQHLSYAESDILYFYTEGHYTKWYYEECHYAECRGACKNAQFAAIENDINKSNKSCVIFRTYENAFTNRTKYNKMKCNLRTSISIGRAFQRGFMSTFSESYH